VISLPLPPWLPYAGIQVTMLSQLRRVVFVDGCRIPFKMSNTDYKDLISVDLGRAAIAGLINRLPGLNPGDLSGVIFGTVIQEGALGTACLHGCAFARRFSVHVSLYRGGFRNF
jgi:acetyl-CoA acetyltransferase